MVFPGAPMRRMQWRWALKMTLPALQLDFKQSPRHWPWLGLLLLIAGAAWVAYAANEARVLSGQIDLAEARLEVLAKRGKAQPAPPIDAQVLQQEVRQANDILQQLTLPWNALFQVLESTSEKQIALLAVQPDARKHIVRLSGEAKNFDALLAYIARLEQSRVLNHVYLTSHEVRTQDAEKPVRFALVANWTVQP
jgi:Tfp pilus assembly protein PilN